MSRPLFAFAMFAYCAGILMACDFVYSNFVAPPEQHFRIPDPQYDHGLTKNFDGHDITANFYRVFTNNWGFKDSTVRDIPAKGRHRRILLIGDSFTEGVGLRFEQTFAGLLHHWGQKQPPLIEFLNAGVATYSPVIYYRKLKHLIEKGLEFDEVMVFVDISDVSDEASKYFCIDENPRYRRHCRDEAPSYAGAQRTLLQRNFRVIDATIRVIKAKLSTWRSEGSKAVFERVRKSPLALWTVSSDVGRYPHSLGIKAGIERSLENMQRLADLLASRQIKLTVVVYPWMLQMDIDDRDSRQVAIWRDFCSRNGVTFIDLFPVFLEAKNTRPDWLERLFLPGDFHFSAEGNEIIFHEIVRRLCEHEASFGSCPASTPAK